MDVNISQGGAEDVEEIAALVGASFPDNPKADPAVVRWQYFGLGPAPIVMVARDAGRIVAHWTVLPVPARLDGRDGWIGRGADGVVAASHRGHGLWRDLARATYQACEDRGIPAVFSYPNASSVRGLEQVGWRPVGEMRAHIVLTGDTWLAARTHAPTFLARLARRGAFRPVAAPLPAVEVSGPPADVDRLWARVAPTVAWGIRRDGNWLRWRYARPGKDYRWFEVRDDQGLAGLAVTGERSIEGGRFADVLELLATSADAASSLASGLHHANASSAVDALTAGALLDGDLSRHLRLGGFRIVPRRLQPQQLRVGLAVTGRQESLADAPWSLQWGDADHL